MEDERTELQRIEDDLLVHLKGKLADGTIKSMDSKLLLEILTRRDGEITRKGTPLPGLSEDLPFENGERIVK